MNINPIYSMGNGFCLQDSLQYDNRCRAKRTYHAWKGNKFYIYEYIYIYKSVSHRDVLMGELLYKLFYGNWDMSNSSPAFSRTWKCSFILWLLKAFHDYDIFP